MNLQDIFAPERIRTGLAAREKRGVFNELVDLGVSTSSTGSRGKILVALEERENKMSTGIRRGIAIPHCITDGVVEILGAIGISPQGIDYDAVDGEPVHLVFLLVSPIDDPEGHLEVLKKLTRLFEQQIFFDDIVRGNSPRSIHEVIAEYEKILT